MISLGFVLEWYGRNVTPGKRGAEKELNLINLLCKHPIAQRHLAAIKPHDIAAFREELVAGGYSRSTIEKRVVLISQAYKVAVSELGCYGLMNPCQHIRLPAARPGRDRRMSQDEERQLLQTAREGRFPWLAPIIEWSLATAMRRSETLSLDRQDIQGNIAILRLTKNGEPRFVPLSSRAVAVLEELPQQGKLFPYDGAQVWHAFQQTRRDAQKHFGSACCRGLRFHDLRHCAISAMAERELDVMELASISGHKTLNMLFRYTHHRASRLAEKLG